MAAPQSFKCSAHSRDHPPSFLRRQESRVFGQREYGGISTNWYNALRIIGVFALLAGVALIVVSRDGQPMGVAIGVILMVVGFWLSYVKNEIAKMRGDRNEGR